MFRNIAAVIFVTGVLIGGYYRYRAEKSGEQLRWREEGIAVMILLRLFGIALWLSVLTYLIKPDWMSWAQIGLPDFIRWIGVITGFLSLPLMYWLFKSIGTNITQTVGTRKDHQLVTSGPYRYVRHPLYSVGTMLFLSFALISANWFIALVGLGGFIMLMVRLPKEEENLIAKFGGEYREYMKSTGRLVPKVRL